jgi:hypothetical protein
VLHASADARHGSCACQADLLHRVEACDREVSQINQRQRAFEKQQAAEIEAAKERDRQAYRERGWPSG